MAINFPSEIIAGLTLLVPLELPDYPAASWTVTAHLRGAAVIDLTATEFDGVRALRAAPVTTGAWVPGSYWMALRATDGVDVIELGSGQVRIRPDLVSAGAEYDGRTHAEKVLASIEAVIEGRATIDQESYRINNRELRRTPLADLRRMRLQYIGDVKREREAAGDRRGIGREHRVKF